MKNQEGKCANDHCPGKNKKILGRGLCVTCYQREKKNGFLRYPIKGIRVVKIPTKTHPEVEVFAEIEHPPVNPVIQEQPAPHISIINELLDIAKTCARITEEAVLIAREYGLK